MLTLRGHFGNVSVSMKAALGLAVRTMYASYNKSNLEHQDSFVNCTTGILVYAFLLQNTEDL